MIPYINWDWHGSDITVQGILDDFKESRYSDGKYPDVTAADIDLIAASYTYEDYSGSAIVVYRDRRDGKVYEVNGGHCSCNGLEGQWSPEEVEPREILNRPAIVSHEDESLWQAIHDGLEGIDLPDLEVLRMADDGCPHGE